MKNLATVSFVKLELSILANVLGIEEENCRGTISSFSGNMDHFFKKLDDPNIKPELRELLERLKKKHTEQLQKKAQEWDTRRKKKNDLEAFSIDSIMQMLHDGIIKHKYQDDWTYLADLETKEFLERIAGKIAPEEETILITPESYRIGFAFKADWHNMMSFCENVFDEIFNLYFVQEHDYIFIFPNLKKICTYHHANWSSQIYIL
ncbi:hypothetical protein AD998_16050 [bacterium 336/3]|nr:hypothetical protein AD998_16050 [bacterium 336/3]